MAEKTISTRHKQKYDTSTNWATNNIVLLAGEIGIESDTNKFKIGNGTSAWNELDYTGGSEIPLYSTIGQNTDGAMTQKATTDALPQAVTVTLTESQDFNDIVITNEQFDLLLSNPENYLIIETINNYINVDLKYHRSQYASMSMEGVSQEMLTFECINSTANALYTQRIDSLTIIRQTQNGESIIAVQDDILDFTTFVPNNRTINGKLLTNNITLTATDVNALPDTTEIPSTLADLTDDSTHRTVTDTEKSTWNNKSSFSGSYNDLTDKPTIPTLTSQLTNDSNFVSDSAYVHTDNNYTTSEKNKLAGIETGAEVNTVTSVNGKTGTVVLTATDVGALPDSTFVSTININGQPQSVVNFNSDPQTQLDNIANNTTKIANSFGGFVAGEGASASIDNMPSMNDGGVAIGKGAQVVSGGGAIGDGAYCYENGFAGGKLAKATNNCIQLGWGTNDEPQSLKIYGDNIYNANTHTLTVQNFTLNGGTISYDSSTDTFTI